MPTYDIVISVDLEDDIEAERILDEVQKALHPLPRPDKEWTFALSCHAERASPGGKTYEAESTPREPDMLGPGGDTLPPRAPSC